MDEAGGIVIPAHSNSDFKGLFRLFRKGLALQKVLEHPALLGGQGRVVEMPVEDTYNYGAHGTKTRKEYAVPKQRREALLAWPSKASCPIAREPGSSTTPISTVS